MQDRASFPYIPWATPDLWQEANTALGFLLELFRPKLDHSLFLAGKLGEEMELIFPLMDRLCRRTCSTCTDVCCRHASVWIEFRDLLFLHLAGLPVPGQQLIAGRGQHCSYAGDDGCRLARCQRPLICTLYLCPAQTRLLREAPDTMERTWIHVGKLKQLRRDMEASFLRVIT